MLLCRYGKLIYNKKKYVLWISAVKCLIWAVFANGDIDTKSAYNLSKGYSGN